MIDPQKNIGKRAFRTEDAFFALAFIQTGIASNPPLIKSSARPRSADGGAHDGGAVMIQRQAFVAYQFSWGVCGQGGRHSVMRVPTPSRVITSKYASWASAIHLAMASPNPVPPSRLRALSER